MMQSIGPGKQARAGEAEWRSPPLICHILQAAARLCDDEPYQMVQADVQSYSADVLGATDDDMKKEKATVIHCF